MNALRARLEHWHPRAGGVPIELPGDLECEMLERAGVTTREIDYAINRWVESCRGVPSHHWGYIRAVAWGETVKRLEMHAQVLEEILAAN